MFINLSQYCGECNSKNDSLCIVHVIGTLHTISGLLASANEGNFGHVLINCEFPLGYCCVKY